jgi:multiple sugar transport system permease protein
MTVTEAAGAGGLVVGSSGHQPPARRRRPKPWAWLPYALVVPILAYEGVFVIYPIIKGIFTSFTSQKLGQAGTFSTENYSQMFSDTIFWGVVRTTLEFTASVLVLVLLVGLGIALLLNWSFRGRTLVRGVLAMPWAMPDIPTVLTFLLMMDPNFGVFNRIIGWFGIDKHVAWLTDPHVAFLSVVAITVWKGFPFYALITLSALQAVPDDLIEAAKVDGASTIRRFWHVILPAITPTMLLLAVLAFIYSLQTFSLIYLTTGGGPGNKTTTLSLLIYNEAFQFFNYSYASAIAVVGLVLSLIGTGLFILIERRLVRSR